MRVLNWLNCIVSAGFVVSWIFLSCFPGFAISGVVSLESIKIYKTHELFRTEPTVFFRCKGENGTELPDVKEINVSYTFNGEESWQPLTQLASKKCKRCGFYEEDNLKPDDVFDEWEFCPKYFWDSDGKYRRIKVEEFDATFLCLQCASLAADANASSGTHDSGKGRHLAVIIVISTLASTVLIVGLLAAYKYWLKKKREQEQARFLKLFEDEDDIEDELGFGTDI
ncbi:hypothetical protein K2173_002124 [Erythroxylum novogranatense]|uniref:DUF7953 domain-containing protein n=1 Tax=Erythroxylum novogranatense TaxID=1862640 RepID=A0AAV8SQI3_9ROSI|nr:hypothetical protein K2173_002124 [Erythroxylum novogranatense]